MTLPKHSDPIARFALLGLFVVVLYATLALPAGAASPAQPAPAPVFAPEALSAAAPALAAEQTLRPRIAPLQSEQAAQVEQATAEPTQAPAQAPSEAPAIAQAQPTSTPVHLEQSAPAGGTPAGTIEQGQYSTDSRIPAGAQTLHQMPDYTYITVAGSQVQYVVNPQMQVTDVHLSGAEGIAAQQAPQLSAEQQALTEAYNSLPVQVVTQEDLNSQAEPAQVPARKGSGRRR